MRRRCRTSIRAPGMKAGPRHSLKFRSDIIIVFLLSEITFSWYYLNNQYSWSIWTGISTRETAIVLANAHQELAEGFKTNNKLSNNRAAIVGSITFLLQIIIFMPDKEYYTYSFDLLGWEASLPTMLSASQFPTMMQVLSFTLSLFQLWCRSYRSLHHFSNHDAGFIFHFILQSIRFSSSYLPSPPIYEYSTSYLTLPTIYQGSKNLMGSVIWI